MKHISPVILFTTLIIQQVFQSFQILSFQPTLTFTINQFSFCSVPYSPTPQHHQFSIIINMQFSIVLNGLVALLAGSAVAVKLDMRLTAPKALVEERQQNTVLNDVRNLSKQPLSRIRHANFSPTQCTPENDCCFSTVGACRRQSSTLLESWVQCPNTKLCPSMGVTVQDCVRFPSITPRTVSWLNILTTSLERRLLFHQDQVGPWLPWQVRRTPANCTPWSLDSEVSRALKRSYLVHVEKNCLQALAYRYLAFPSTVLLEVVSYLPLWANTRILKTLSNVCHKFHNRLRVLN